ncbi:MAG: lytic murein transglycosylase [Rickettsiales bacterium]|jgi:membrane-bound lytic murein transglycosylase B|nr:lytic murein transglycosylase [Rickettsiales bacterium]
MKRLLPIAALLLAISATAAEISPETDEEREQAARFARWIPEFKAKLKAAYKVSDKTLSAIFDGAKYEYLAVRDDSRQPEFRKSFWQYYNTALGPARVKSGRENLARNANVLSRVHAKYGAQPQVITALWGMETNYGKVSGNYRLGNALATLAFDPRRSEFFAKEAGEFARIVEAGSIDADARGSWAGAFGNFQFMPSTFARYAVDGSGDAKIDLMYNRSDSFASAANYLKQMGWNGKEKWGRPVKFDRDNRALWQYANSQTELPVGEFAAMGLKAYDWTDLPKSSKTMARLIAPEGQFGPAFLAYGNFRRIMRWNASTNYALSVGLLSDAIAGGLARLECSDECAARKPLTRDQIKELQSGLIIRGFYKGEPDGRLGAATYDAVRAYQNALISARSAEYAGEVEIPLYSTGAEIVPDGHPGIDVYTELGLGL